MKDKEKKGYNSLNVVEGSEHVKVSSSVSKVDNGFLKTIAKKQIKHKNPFILETMSCYPKSR